MLPQEIKTGLLWTAICLGNIVWCVYLCSLVHDYTLLGAMLQVPDPDSLEGPPFRVTGWVPIFGALYCLNLLIADWIWWFFNEK